MKAQERHNLKTNEFAERMAWIAELLTTHRTQSLSVTGVALAAAVIIGGYFFFHARSQDQASAMLGSALAIQQSPVVAATALPMGQQAGSFPTATARGEAAIAAFQKVADAYPSGDTGAAARYYIGTSYLSIGRGADAEKAFAAAASIGTGTLYGDMAMLGRGQALAQEAKYDDAVKTLTDLSVRRDTSLPIDGVLMELARVCQKAGKLPEARAAFKRIVAEFQQSSYAAEAQKQLSTMG
jgi:TolA-binding protein